MKKTIFGAIAALIISGSALANTGAKILVEPKIENSKEVVSESILVNKETKIVKDAINVYCIVTVKKYENGVLVSTNVYAYDVSDNATLGAAQCQALKLLHILAA